MYHRSNTESFDEIIEAEVLSKEFSLDEAHLLMRYALHYNDIFRVEIIMNRVNFPVTNKEILSHMYTLCNKIEVLKLSKCLIFTDNASYSTLSSVEHGIWVIMSEINHTYGDTLADLKEFFKHDSNVPKMMNTISFPVISRKYATSENIYS